MNQPNSPQKHHPLPFVISSTSTCLRQVEGEMNEGCEAVITTITPNGSATLPFVIPSEAEGSAVQFFGRGEFVPFTLVAKVE